MNLARLSIVCLLPVLAACSVTDKITPFRIDVRQGNLVTQEMVAMLKPGMSKDQVRFALGTPLVVDVFHADRWEYIYRFKPGRGALQQRRLTVFFEDGRLSGLDGDVVAQGADGEESVTEAPKRVIEIGAPAPAAGPVGAPGAADKSVPAQ